jgi:mono/diheme cytochrome c family protein
MMKAMVPAIFLSGALLASGAAFGQGMSLGEFEYNNSCVACHGASGKGDGPVTDFLSGASVPDLTVIQKNNGGVFPVSAVYAVIDGSDVASVHGTRDMPIWGNRFRARISEDEDPYFSPAERESYATARTLALVDYLASIQEQ